MSERWRIQHYQSGTHIVTRASGRRPHYYIYAPDGIERWTVCEQLRDWLNGEGERPAWLDDMERVSDEQAEHPNGRPIYTTGPYVDRNPPACDWTDCMDSASVAERKHLMDVLVPWPTPEGEQPGGAT